MSRPRHWAMWARARLAALDRLTRPVDPETRAAYARRWADLPARSRTAAQVIGRHGVGCEGTHGVFPRCNFACRPCYHSAGANRVRTDGDHTVARVFEQMALLRRLRGPHGHAQLIGGEVTLLAPEDHARALEAMRSFGRKPMSMTHGDFGYDHLARICVDQNGRRRFTSVSFAGHFDTTMIGRRGIRRPRSEADLDPMRRAFCDMFARLRREHRVGSFLAHSMTVTPDNVAQIPDVVRSCRDMGWRMLSFQPAANLGDETRRRGDVRPLDADAVWAQIEAGAGARLPCNALEVGDTRCNRTAWGFYVGDRWHPLLDDADPRDLVARDAFFRHFGGVHFNAPPLLLGVRLSRAAATHPRVIPLALRWAVRTTRRAGPLELLRHGARPMTFVMHRFMNAEDVAPAWELLERQVWSQDPTVLETQERLAACSYAMAHPETGRLVPACVQHAVYDRGENEALGQLLPLPTRRATGPPG